MESIISYLICAVLVFIIAKIVFKGTRTILGFLINIAAGGLTLWVLDLIGVSIPINWITAGIVGLLGVPGVVVVVVLKYVFHLI